MKGFIFAPLLLLIVVPLVFAEISIDINVEDSFSSGETASFEYSIYSDSSQQIIFMPSVFCSDAPIAELKQNLININAGETYSGKYEGATIDESIEPQTCTAYVQILSPVEIIEQKQFVIETPPSFYFDLKMCKDSACENKAKVFLVGDNIYLDYDSEVSNPLITITLTYPDKRTAQLNVPGSVRATDIGTYEMEISAEKQDYKKIKQKQNFAVIDEKPEIEFAGVCNVDGRCEAEETKDNCPQDCKPKGVTNNIMMFLIIIVVVIGLVVLYHWMKTKKATKKSKKRKRR